jgi:hypothetical protein
MNDQSNPVGTDQTEIAAKENGRRRLVRGAVSLAPVVLTLRSGGLAAASCTGAVALVNVNSGGKIDQPPPGVAEGQACISNPIVCESSSKISGGTPVGTVEKRGDNLFCGNGGTGGQVAILSSASATSFMGSVSR